MNHQDQYEREEEDITRAEADGEISKEQMWQELKDLQREYRAAAEEAAQEAADREREQW